MPLMVLVNKDNGDGDDDDDDELLSTSDLLSMYFAAYILLTLNILY